MAGVGPLKNPMPEMDAAEDEAANCPLPMSVQGAAPETATSPNHSVSPAWVNVPLHSESGKDPIETPLYWISQRSTECWIPNVAVVDGWRVRPGCGVPGFAT